MSAIPMGTLGLYFKLRQLIRAQRWAAAYTIADQLDLLLRGEG